MRRGQFVLLAGACALSIGALSACGQKSSLYLQPGEKAPARPPAQPKPTAAQVKAAPTPQAMPPIPLAPPPPRPAPPAKS